MLKVRKQTKAGSICVCVCVFTCVECVCTTSITMLGGVMEKDTIVQRRRPSGETGRTRGIRPREALREKQVEESGRGGQDGSLLRVPPQHASKSLHYK